MILIGLASISDNVLLVRPAADDVSRKASYVKRQVVKEAA